MTVLHANDISRLIMICREEKDMGRKIELYNEIREKLPDPEVLKIPSMITDDYIDSSLDKI
jgi:hypothetical protein